VLAASIIALMVEAASTSETSVTSTRLHGATTQKTLIFILAAMRTSNFKSQMIVLHIIFFKIFLYGKGR
jgi:hypothetical protein